MRPSPIRLAFFGLALSSALLCLCATLPARAQDDSSGDGGEKPLFAPDLSNAIQQGPWEFKDGILVAQSGGTLWTKKSYGNFVLDLDFKVSKGANSGVFLHSYNIHYALGNLEIQVHENTDGSKYGMVGALYDAKAPSQDVAKPVGEWNHYTITFIGSKLSLVFNGVKVLDLDLNDWTTAHLNPDGTTNKYPKPLDVFVRPGPLGLQGLHGKEKSPVWYRNIRIKELP